MYRIPEAFIQHWEETPEGRLPALVDTICPHPGLPVAFTLKTWTEVPGTALRVSTTTSPRDPRPVSFLWEPALTLPDDAVPSDGRTAVLYMHPAPPFIRSVVCRRTLEEIARTLLPEDRQSLSLGLKIQALAKQKDLAEPIMKLADLLKRSGGLNAYFELEQIPDRQAATSIIELMDLLIAYLFILPGKIELLHREIDAREGLAQDAHQEDAAPA